MFITPLLGDMYTFTQYLIGFLEFIFERLRHKNPDGSINIMYTIHG